MKKLLTTTAMIMALSAGFASAFALDILSKRKLL